MHHMSPRIDVGVSRKLFIFPCQDVVQRFHVWLLVRKRPQTVNMTVVPDSMREACKEDSQKSMTIISNNFQRSLFNWTVPRFCQRETTASRQKKAICIETNRRRIVSTIFTGLAIGLDGIVRGSNVCSDTFATAMASGVNNNLGSRRHYQIFVRSWRSQPNQK